MAKPPAATPSSDIEGVNRDARISEPQKTDKPDPGSQLNQARDQSTARPHESAPDAG